MKRQWTHEEAWAWYDRAGPIRGFNYTPSNCMNFAEIWQAEYHDEVTAVMDRELALAEELGLNSVRMRLPFEVYLAQHDSFMANLEDFLNRLASHGMTMMPIFFSDCCVPKELYRPMPIGVRTEPVKGYFGGSPVTPFDGTEKVGYLPIDEPETWGDVERFVKEIVGRYGKDPRILFWDIWNEPGNMHRGTKSLPLMERCFRWAREMDPDQPLSAGPCGLGGEFPYGYLNKPWPLTEMERAAVELSDLMNFHFYGDYTHTKMYIDYLRQFGMPMVCSEWLHRPFRSIFETHYPLFREENVGTYFFGFVNGKKQFNEPWEQCRSMPDVDLSLWMHDIFHGDYTPYSEREIQALKEYTGKA